MIKKINLIIFYSYAQQTMEFQNAFKDIKRAMSICQSFIFIRRSKEKGSRLMDFCKS